MKKLICSLMAAFICSLSMSAAKSHVLELNIKGGGTNLPATVKRAMENNAVNLLTMLTEAQESGSRLNFRGIPISKEAQATIQEMWKFQPLKVTPKERENNVVINEDLLNLSTVNAYQIRNIPVLFFPRETPGSQKKSEVSIVFSPNGVIEEFNISIAKHQYDQLIGNAHLVQDLENRKMLAFWMDQLKTAYETKNKQFMKSLFDDDALIITGVRSTKRIPADIKFVEPEKFDYYVKTKKEYLTSLNRIFANNKEISVNFKDQQYGANLTYLTTDSRGEEMPRYYMVWCTQEWNATNYQDVGRLFILWDFKDPAQPTILVRAWTHPDDPRQFDDDDFILSGR